jgi:hypothetical protein
MKPPTTVQKNETATAAATSANGDTTVASE